MCKIGTLSVKIVCFFLCMLHIVMTEVYKPKNNSCIILTLKKEEWRIAHKYVYINPFAWQEQALTVSMYGQMLSPT